MVLSQEEERGLDRGKEYEVAYKRPTCWESLRFRDLVSGMAAYLWINTRVVNSGRMTVEGPFHTGTL